VVAAMSAGDVEVYGHGSRIVCDMIRMLEQIPRSACRKQWAWTGRVHQPHERVQSLRFTQAMQLERRPRV
jgi:hypothetical protein